MSKKRGLPQNVEMRHDEHYVDTLSRRFDQHVGKYVPLDLVDPNPAQPRSQLGNLEDLKASILSKGVLEPLLVLPANGSGRYMIISGERRFHAAMEAGLEEIPVVEIDADESEVLEIALIENLQRKDLTPFEEADGYSRLMEQHEYTQDKVSQVVGKSRSSVAETLRLRRVPDAIRQLCRAEGIEAKSVLIEIGRLESPDDMRRLVEAIAAGDVMDRAAIREHKKAVNKGAAPPVKPFVYRFAQKDLPYKFQLRFDRTDVDPAEVIGALENILDRLKAEQLAN